MIEQDTVQLLRECDAGVKMGVSSIDDVLKYVRSEKLRSLLSNCKAEHEAIGGEIQRELERFRDEGKDPGLVAQKMSEITANVKLAVNESDHTIADLMTDGCNMGVKSINGFLNQYKAAEEYAKDIAKRIVNLEERLVVDIREFL